MQEPINFESEIVQQKNLDFLNTSMEKNIKDVVTLFTNSEPGIANGLSLTGIVGNNYFTVAPGLGIMGDGEMSPLYVPNNVNITFTGSQSVYLKLTNVVYNPDPSENPAGSANIITNIDPNDSSLVAVQNYNLGQVTTTSGTNYINLGTITADGSMKFLSSSTTGAQYVKIGGILNLSNNTIDGSTITAGSIDSTAFTSPLTADITLGPGVDIVATTNNSIGSLSNPIGNIYSITGTFHELNGMSPILTDSLWQKMGASFESTGSNYLQLDVNNHGTQFAQSMTIRRDLISTLGANNDINITTDRDKSINLNSLTIVNSTHDLIVKRDLRVSGTAYLNNVNLNGVNGNFAVGGTLSYNSTNEGLSNLIRNSNFSIASGNNSGTLVSPANWILSGSGNGSPAQALSIYIANTGNEIALSPTTKNTYIGDPHASSWMLGSGSFINPTGFIINQPLPELKLNTSYNLSYYTKGFINYTGIAINPSVSGTSQLGSPSIITLGASPIRINNNEWTRQSYQFLTPQSGTDFGLNLNVMAPTSIGSTGVFGITAVQLTEGPALIPYSPKNGTNQVIIKSFTDFVSNPGSSPITVTSNQFSRSFYTKGGLCLINASLVVSLKRVTAATNQDNRYIPNITLDGVQVCSVLNSLPYAMAATIPAGYVFGGNGNMSYSTYLEPGWHTLNTRLTIGGGSTGSGWEYRIYGSNSSAITSLNPGSSNISITIFE